MVITMEKLRMAHASTHGARKPPGPKKEKEREKKERLNNGDNNGQATHGARKPPGPISFGPGSWRVSPMVAFTSIS